MAIMDRVGRTRAVRAWVPAPGVYLTDEQRLFRIVSRQVIEDESVVELEDCRTLATRMVTDRELAAMRPVHPAGASV